MAKQHKGKYFENETKRIVSQLNPNREVMQNVEIRGVLSEESREVDVVVDPTKFDFLAMECKDLAAPVGLPILEGWSTKLRDIGAKNGAIVSNSGYTRGAKRAAKKLGITLLNLVNTRDPEIKAVLIAPCAIVYTKVKQWTVLVNCEKGVELPDKNNLDKMAVTDAQGQTKTTKELAYVVLQDEGFDKSTGIRDAVWRNLTTYDTAGNPIRIIELRVRFDIEQKHHLGKLDVSESEGLYDVHESSYRTSSIAMGPFGVDSLEKEFKEVSSIDVEAAQPSIVMHWGVSLD